MGVRNVSDWLDSACIMGVVMGKTLALMTRLFIRKISVECLS